MQGKQRGPDTITVLQTGGLRIVHMGDIGELQLRDDQVADIGRVDVLMIPSAASSPWTVRRRRR